MEKHKLWKWLIAISLFMVFLVACSSETQATEEPQVSSTPEAQVEPTEEPTAEAPEISQPIARWNAVSEQGNWVLIGYDDALNPTVVEPGTYVTINFSDSDDQVSGSGGCNVFFTTYTADDNNNLTINGPIGATAMACEPGMEQESLFFAALETITGYTVTDTGRLLLDYSSGANYDQQLVFTPETSLVDTLWILTSYGDPNNSTLAEAGVVTSATFSADGSLSGSAGCNQYTTGYTATENQISIQPMAITAMACETGMDQEQAFLQILEGAESYRLGLEALEITTAGGAQVLRFTARHLPLENVRWNLESIDGQPLPDGINANAVFTPASSPAAQSEENTVNGSAGCNGFFGPYTIEGDSFTAGPFGITQVMCEEPVMQIEQAFLAGLDSAQSYQTVLNQLTVTTESGSLVFLADRLPLEGPVWVLTGMGTIEEPQSPAEGTNFTATFGRQAGMPSGVKSGETGCNDYAAAYFATADEMKVNLPQLSQNTCTEGQQEAEQGYFLSLNAAREYRILGNEMSVYYNGSVLNFVGSFPTSTPEVGPLVPLDGTQWWLASIDTFVVVPGTEVTAAFAINPDGNTGTISGSGGCNQYNADITGVFTLSPINAAKALCDTPEGVMEQEAAYLNALGNATGIFFTSDTLEIRTTLETLVFTNKGPSPVQPLPSPTTPAAVINAPTEAMVGDTITFDGSGSTSSVDITSYQWDFGDGNTAEGVTIEHTYTAAGVYDVSLTITDADGQMASASIQVTIHANLVGPTWILGSSSITLIFDGSTLSGNAGCNDYNAGYTTPSAAGPTNDISVGPITATGMLCDDEIMNQEQAYLSSLQAASSYTINQNSLTLTTADGPLAFSAAVATPS